MPVLVEEVICHSEARSAADLPQEAGSDLTNPLNDAEGMVSAPGDPRCLM